MYPAVGPALMERKQKQRRNYFIRCFGLLKQICPFLGLTVAIFEVFFCFSFVSEQVYEVQRSFGWILSLYSPEEVAIQPTVLSGRVFADVQTA